MHASKTRGGFFSEQLSKFLLPSDAVRTRHDLTPCCSISSRSTEAAANAAAWNRPALECTMGQPPAAQVLTYQQAGRGRQTVHNSIFFFCSNFCRHNGLRQRARRAVRGALTC